MLKKNWQFGEMGYDISIEYNKDEDKTDEDYRTYPKPVLWEYLEVPARKKLHDTYTTLLTLRTNNPEAFSNPDKVEMQVGSNWSNGRRISLQHSGLDLILIGNYNSSLIDVNPQFTSADTLYDLFSGTTQTVTESNKGEVTITLPPHTFQLYTTAENPTANEKPEAAEDIIIWFQGDDAIIKSNNPVTDVYIYTVSGQQIKQAKETTRINLSGISSGLCLFSIETAGQITTQWIIKSIK